MERVCKATINYTDGYDANGIPAGSPIQCGKPATEYRKAVLSHQGLTGHTVKGIKVRTQDCYFCPEHAEKFDNDQQRSKQ